MRVAAFLLLALGLMSAIVGCGGTGAGFGSGGGNVNYALAWVGQQDGDSDLVRLRQDLGFGSVVRAQSDQWTFLGYALSRVGRYAYLRNEAGATTLFVESASGDFPVKSWDGPADPASLTWSPDGDAIAVVQVMAGGSNVVAIDLQGNVTQVTTVNDVRSDSSIAWAENDVIYLVRGVDASARIYSVPSTGGSPTQVSDTPAMNPAVSPDGSKLAFNSPNRTLAIVRNLLTTSETTVKDLTSFSLRFNNVVWWDGNSSVLYSASSTLGGGGEFGTVQVSTGTTVSTEVDEDFTISQVAARGSGAAQDVE